MEDGRQKAARVRGVVSCNLWHELMGNIEQVTVGEKGSMKLGKFKLGIWWNLRFCGEIGIMPP